MEVLLKMTKKMSRKMMTSLPTLRIGLMSMIHQRGASLERLVRRLEGPHPRESSLNLRVKKLQD
jgi:hypothetical protein